ncbi:MAG: NifU family protein [Acidobacteria bacterium]|nr:NifU family protein [Acidobacteriota bacterium]
MIEFTERAKKEILAAIEAEEEPSDFLIRVRVEPGMPAEHRYHLELVRTKEKEAEDEEFDAGGFRVRIDPASRQALAGGRVDFVVSPTGAGFKVDPPKVVINDPRAPAVQKLIDERINPGVGMHGGHVELIDLKENRVYLRLGGGCQGCGMVDVTLKQGIQTMIREEIPSITEILDVTDHASGTNPYYQPEK